MALIPSSIINIGEDVEIVSQPTYTYYYDTVNKRIIGKIDGKQAMKQAIYKIIETERYEYLIYDWNFGIELESLIGKDILFISAELERIFLEALKQDDRVLSLSDFIIKEESDSIFISFTANTTEGNIDIEGVTINV